MLHCDLNMTPAVIYRFMPVNLKVSIRYTCKIVNALSILACRAEAEQYIIPGAQHNENGAT